MKKIKLESALFLFPLPIMMLACGFLSVFFGKELTWDLINYHFYNPYAFFHHRSNIDFWPASFIARNINPTIDFLTYFLIMNFSARSAEFLLGALHGINYWLLFVIARFFLPNNFKNLGAIFLATIGLYAPLTLTEIGSFQNDNLISIFVLGFVALHLKALADYTDTTQFSWKILFFAGLLLGIGTGLKYTAALFVIGSLFAAAVLPIPYKKRVILMTWIGFAMMVGFLLSAGYWMLEMWNQHHNPFFPFFNNVFHSPDFANINWQDKRFLPQGLWQLLFYPYYFSWGTYTADAPFRDFRFLLVHAFFMLAGLCWLWKKSQRTWTPLTLPIFWLYTFFISSYIAWQYYFSISRYLVSLEMLCPLIIYLLIKQIISNFNIRAVILTIIFYTLLFFMVPSQMARVRWYDSSFFNVQLPTFVKRIPKAVVLIAYPAYVMDTNPTPQTYLIPFFPENWHFIGMAFWNEKFILEEGVQEKINRLIKDDRSIFLLSTKRSIPELYNAAQKFGLKAHGPCGIITSDRQKLLKQKILLCPVTRVGIHPNNATGQLLSI